MLRDLRNFAQLNADCGWVSFVGKVPYMTRRTVKEDMKNNKTKLLIFYLKRIFYDKTNVYLGIYFSFLIIYPLFLINVIEGHSFAFFYNLDYGVIILLVINIIIVLLGFLKKPNKILDIIYDYFFIVFIIVPFIIIIWILLLIFEFNLQDFSNIMNTLYEWKWIGIACICFYNIIKKEDFFNILLSICTNISLSFLLCFVVFIVYSSLRSRDLSILSCIRSEEILNLDVISKLDLENQIINKDIQFESYFNKKSSSRNIVNLLCKFWFLDVIIKPENYLYIPSYFQISSITLPSGFSLSTAGSIEWLYPYDNPYSTMPILSPLLESLMAVREETLWSEIIPSLTSELRPGFEEWQGLTVLVEYFDTNRSQHPLYGALYDVFTEYLGPYNRTRILLDNYENELDLLRELLEHNGNLLEEAGLLDDSYESESISSNWTESNSDNN